MYGDCIIDCKKRISRILYYRFFHNDESADEPVP